MPPHLPVALGVSTKEYPHEEALARCFEEEFIRRAEPRDLILCLPHNFLTKPDEERIEAWRMLFGRTEGARLMLQLMTRRGEWVPRLQQGLRHNQVRLDDLADKLDKLQREIPVMMEIEDDAEAMEIDADREPDPAYLGGQLQAILQGGKPQDLSDDALNRYKKLVLTQIAELFFLKFIQDLKQIPHLVEYFERIANVIASTAANGCLEIRFRVTCSRDVHALQGLLESGLAREALEKGALTQERRERLAEKAAKYGLKWRKMALKVTFQADDLDKVETYLKVKEAFANPTSTAQALLLKAAGEDAPWNQVIQDHIRCLPCLLLSFVDWLMTHHPGPAQTAVRTLSKPPLDNALVETMASCRDYFGLDNNNHGEELARMASEMIRAYEAGEFEPNMSFQIAAHLEDPQAARPYVEVEPDSELAETVSRLQAAHLVVPVDVSGKENTFTFATPYVANFAFSCLARMSDDLPQGLVLSALKLGSEYAVLHLIDLALELMPLSSSPGPSIATQLRDILTTGDIQPHVVEMFLSCYSYFADPDLANLPKTFWSSFSAEAKSMFLQLRRSEKFSLQEKITKIPLLPVKESDKKVREMLQQVLSARQEVDLSEKLRDVNQHQLQALLTCLQYTNVARFKLQDEDDWVNLVVDRQLDPKGFTGDVLQPGLNLGKNSLEDWHIQCLIHAMPGLESVIHCNLAGCTVSFENLQQLLDAMHVQSVEELILSGVPLTTGGRLLRFSHLKRLRVLEMGNTGLRDDHMSQLAEQLQALVDLRELTLDQNVVTTLGLSRLAPALASRKVLRVLRLAYCSLDAGAAYVLGSVLAAARDLRVLNLSNCSLYDSGLQHLSLALREHVHLRKISLRSGDYSPAGLTPFLGNLARCTRMQHIEMGDCSLAEDGDHAASRLITALSKSGHWDYLGLWRCELGRTGFMEQLGTLTWQLRGLSTLVLQDNVLKDIHIKQLAGALQQGVFHHLRHLNLRQNAIGGEGASALEKSLYHLPYLKELLLQHSYVPPAEAQSLSFAVLEMPAMRILDLSDSYSIDSIQSWDILDNIVRAVMEGNVTAKKTHIDPAEEEREFQVLTDPKMMAFAPGYAKPGVRAETTTTLEAGAEERKEKGDLPVAGTAGEEVHSKRTRAELDIMNLEVVIDGILHIRLGHPA